MEVTRHFTATTFIVHNDKTLLHMHKRLKRWLPVGGHIDRDELPVEAARREALEEAGLEVKFAHEGQQLKRFKDVQELPQPNYLLLEDINPFHQHIDFVFFAKSTTDQLDPSCEAFASLRWFSLAELKETPEMPDDVLELAEQAILFFKKG